MTSNFGEVDKDSIAELLSYFSKTTFKAADNDPEARKIQEKSITLFSKDYRLSVIHNENGTFCSHYPSKLIICEGRHTDEEDKKINESKRLKELFSKARAARCRSRFVMPVILYEDKNICRSATLAAGPEIYGRSGYDYFFSAKEQSGERHEVNANTTVDSSDWDLYNKIRGHDIKLLKSLSVKYIFDLMVEQKKVKFGVNPCIEASHFLKHAILTCSGLLQCFQVIQSFSEISKAKSSVTSSEKVDKEKRYSDFIITSLPYPGCEFFRDFKNNCYSGEGIYFNWNQGFVDAHLNIPAMIPVPLGIEWKRYKSWDLVTLTKNYLLLTLKLLKEGDSGLLVHCISGWDRTPLFISLLRLSLWADGRVHQSLSPSEILYLTISYDWLLFGHDLEDRLTKGEEVFFFCFNFLKHITSDEFSVNLRRSYSLSHRTLKKTDSNSCESTTLLAEERASVRGSTSSLNSLNSDKLSLHMETIVFDNTGEEYESPHSSHGSLSSVNSTSHCNVNNSSNGRVSRSPLLTSEPSSTPVPIKTQSHDQRSSSSICGSWQIISDAGSPRGSTTIRDSPHTFARSSSSTSLSDSIEDMSLRQQKLEAVRSVFLSVYSRTVGYGKREPNSLTGILDSVATKMLKGTWITSV